MALPATRADAPALQIDNIASPGPGVSFEISGRPDGSGILVTDYIVEVDNALEM